MNAMNVIFPYKMGGIWAFNDEEKELDREPYVGEMNVLIDKHTTHIPGAEKGFRLLFSANAFPGHTLTFQWTGEESNGNWYICLELGGEPGWLCPALLKYFDNPPDTLCIKAEAM